MRPHTSNLGWDQRIRRRGTPGFTLIELLVVIAVMAILAAMIFPVMGVIKKNQIKTRTGAELRQLETAIESYKAKLGHYPPDNGTNHLVNQLYYELNGATYAKNGTVVDPTRYLTTDGGVLSVASFTNALNHANSLSLVNTQNPVSGLVNFLPTVDNEEGSTVVNFIKTGFAPAQFQTDATTGLRFLVSSVQWPVTITFPAYSGFVGNYCAWRYNSLNPVNNPGSYDLWVDVLIAGKTNRFSNWNRDPIIVGNPDE